MNGLRNHAVRELAVDEASAGQRLDNFLARVLKGVPKSHLYRIVRSGEVRVNGRRAGPDARLVDGDRVRIPPIRTGEAETPASKTASAARAGEKLVVLHEDDDLIALDKPAGVAVHGGSGIAHGVIERLRAARPDLALTSDFIVGFPGETEEDFRDTLRLVDAVGYSGAFSFKYSQRPGTPGATMHDQIADDVKAERLARLQAAINRNAAAFNARCRGRTFEVLMEKSGRLPGQLTGRSPYLQPVQAMAPERLIGQMVAVTIMDAGTNSLFGMLADSPRIDAELAVAQNLVAAGA